VDANLPRKGEYFCQRVQRSKKFLQVTPQGKEGKEEMGGKPLSEEISACPSPKPLWGGRPIHIPPVLRDQKSKGGGSSDRVAPNPESNNHGNSRSHQSREGKRSLFH